MKWSEHCKIKHLSTRKYLAITEDSSGYKVSQCRVASFVTVAANNVKNC